MIFVFGMSFTVDATVTLYNMDCTIQAIEDYEAATGYAASADLVAYFDARCDGQIE